MSEKKLSIEEKFYQLTSLRRELKTIEFVLNDSDKFGKGNVKYSIKYRKTILRLLLDCQLETFDKEC